MFISTAGSRAKYLDQDVRQGLGLSVLDEFGQTIYTFCLRNGVYSGYPLSTLSSTLISKDRKED